MSDTAAGNGWLTSGIVEVLLPSGWRVRGVLPMLRTLARMDLITPALLEVATRGLDREWLKEAAQDPERRAAIRGYMDALVSSFPREALPAGGSEWLPVTLTPADMATIDQRDLDLLEDVALRIVTPAEASRRAAILLGLPVDDDGQEVGVEALAPFRGVGDGASGGDDGEDVGDSTEPDAGAG